MTDLDTLLRQLPTDPRPDADVNADLEAAIDGALAGLVDCDGWARTYRDYLAPARFLRHFPEQQRIAFEIHAWRIGHLLGLDAARCPAPLQLDLSRPLRLRDAALLWIRFTLDIDPWSGFDLWPLRAFIRPTIDPIGRALWRLATGSGFRQLRQQHRDVLVDVRREPLGFAALVVEEARDIASRSGRVDALRQVIELLHDPILHHRHGDDALALLARAQLYRARAHQRLGDLDAASEALVRWRGLDTHARLPPEQRLLAGEIKARIEMNRGQLVAAGDRLARSVLTIAEGLELPRERRLETFVLVGEYLLRSRLYGDAADIFEGALDWVRKDSLDTLGALHARVVDHLATARWLRFVSGIRPHLFTADVLGDDAFDVLVAHREPFRALRGDIEASAASWLRDGLGFDDSPSLLLYRWQLARALVIDDPHDAVARLVAVGITVATRWPDLRRVDIVFEVLVALRLAGWPLDELVDARPLARLYAIEPEARRVVESILAGRRHRLSVVALPVRPSNPAPVTIH